MVDFTFFEVEVEVENLLHLQSNFFRMVHIHQISPNTLTLERLAELIATPHQLKLSETSRQLIQKNRAYLERILSETDTAIYGVNTGFGKLCDISISQEKLEQLQYNWWSD